MSQQRTITTPIVLGAAALMVSGGVALSASIDTYRAEEHANYSQETDSHSIPLTMDGQAQAMSTEMDSPHMKYDPQMYAPKGDIVPAPVGKDVNTGGTIAKASLWNAIKGFFK